MVPIIDILNLLDAKIIGSIDQDQIIDNVSTISNANDKSLIWLKKSVSNLKDIIMKTNAKVIICTFDNTQEPVDGKIILQVENPRLSFIKVVSAYFTQKLAPGIHPTAFIHPEANVDKTAYIGPFTYVGKSEIGENTIIHGNVFIYDKVRIGRNVEIHAGTVIGADGFGYEKDADGNVHKFPHIGGVCIEDNVDIGSNTCIDKGSLGDTIIRQGTKIDNLVHIAHNVIVGQNSFVIANSMIGGSTKIGDNTWIAPSVSLMNGIQIGNNSTIGMSALVTKNVPEGETWTGIPAKKLSEFLSLQKKLKEL
ncbi:MAG: UDP-3-O-(3-hydroxymyristoyl)glucosamine N-acyltransferase [Saprospiraceae bacterium]|nr:UDP-3-O-(3-hydroxymyristoyl)glucosamine N-acyltransferase [Saprospiraceae bacterium]